MEEGNKFSRNIKTPNWAEEAIFTSPTAHREAETAKAHRG